METASMIWQALGDGVHAEALIPRLPNLADQALLLGIGDEVAVLTDFAAVERAAAQIFPTVFPHPFDGTDARHKPVSLLEGRRTCRITRDSAPVEMRRRC